jgi:hypothetical protein
VATSTNLCWTTWWKEETLNMNRNNKILLLELQQTFPHNRDLNLSMPKQL